MYCAFLRSSKHANKFVHRVRAVRCPVGLGLCYSLLCAIRYGIGFRARLSQTNKFNRRTALTGTTVLHGVHIRHVGPHIVPYAHLGRGRGHLTSHSSHSFITSVIFPVSAAWGSRCWSCSIKIRTRTVHWCRAMLQHLHHLQRQTWLAGPRQCKTTRLEVSLSMIRSPYLVSALPRCRLCLRPRCSRRPRPHERAYRPHLAVTGGSKQAIASLQCAHDAQAEPRVAPSSSGRRLLSLP